MSEAHTTNAENIDSLFVAVTARAWRSPLGNDVQSAMDRLLKGECAASPHDFGPHSYACGLSARVPGEPARTPHHRFVRRSGLLGMEAAHEVAIQAHIKERAEAGARVGVYVGYGGLRAHWSEMMPALMNQQPDQQDLWRRGLRHLHPFWMLRYLSNNAQALFAADLGLRDDGVTCGGATGGAGAIRTAQRALMSGAVDIAVVFAYDSLIHPDVLVDLAERGRATVASDDTWVGPYDRDARGSIPGEGAAALVLERPQDATHRTLGFVSALEIADGHHDEPQPETLSALLTSLIGNTTQNQWLIDGASRANPTHDLLERAVLSAHFGDMTPLISTAASFGMLGAAQPLIQSIALLEILKTHTLPPIPHLRRAMPGPLLAIQQPQTAPPTLHRALGLTTSSPGLACGVCVHLG